MPNFAGVLKDEIRRLARKEAKTNTAATRQAVARYRHEIAALKRQVMQQEKKLASLEQRMKNGAAAPSATTAVPVPALSEDARFSAKSVRSQRRRLDFSAADYGKLVGVSGLTIYNWENGKSRPRSAQLASLVAVRGIGKREALARIGG